MTKISIITPCYNAALFLQETYACLKAQTFTDWEWVVTDDKSSDNSLEILQKLQIDDKRVRIFQHKENLGAATARNTSLKQSRGEFLAFLDSDDLWLPDKLSKQSIFMQKKNIDFSYHDYKISYSEKKVIKEIKTPEALPAKSLLKFNPLATSSVMLRSKLVKNHSILFKTHLRRRQDYLFWYECLLVCSKAYKLNEYQSVYRIVGKSSLSHNKFKMAVIQWKLYRSEFKLNIFKAFYYFCHYALNGIKKYFFR